ncbi:MAG: glycosyltransferase family 2 protein [Ignisphaera sp.]|nr:glycosyltransferase family 2 protein [Ignisphaera sp.]MCX8167778.1 glycosyltransferase family 2 protein [Ignisphaera sp.]MDW8085235.1 glycosyltransferase family 2 protein [Ignisphaera sp.]
MLQFIWGISASIIVFSFIYGIPSLYSIIQDLKRVVWININFSSSKNSSKKPSDLPIILVILPFYREDRNSIEETFTSIVKQKYPREKIHVLIVLENNDEQTHSSVSDLLNILSNAGIASKIVINTSERRGKSTAINKAIEFFKGVADIIVVLDAGDRVVDDMYLHKVAYLISNHGYSVVGTKVYRVSSNAIGRLSYVDTLLWYNVGLPGLVKFMKVPLVSGEGLAFSKSFLEEIGGLPEVLAEDAYLTILAVSKNRNIALLDSVIFEGAPSTIASYVKQRMRWYRGTLECFKDIITKHRRQVKGRTLVVLAIAYLQPVALIAPFISVIVVLSSLVVDVPYITLLVAKVELLSIALAPLYVVLNMRYADPVVFLEPINWIFQGVIALTALMPFKIPWLRTISRAKIDINSAHIRKYGGNSISLE